MAHLLLFRLHIAHAFLTRRDDERNALGHIDSMRCESGDLLGVIAQQTDTRYTSVAEHVGANAVVTSVRREAKREVRLDRVEPPLLERIGFDLVEEADPAPFLTEVHYD